MRIPTYDIEKGRIKVEWTQYKSNRENPLCRNPEFENR